MSDTCESKPFARSIPGPRSSEQGKGRRTFQGTLTSSYLPKVPVDPLFSLGYGAFGRQEPVDRVMGMVEGPNLSIQLHDWDMDKLDEASRCVVCVVDESYNFDTMYRMFEFAYEVEALKSRVYEGWTAAKAFAKATRGTFGVLFSLV